MSVTESPEADVNCCVESVEDVIVVAVEIGSRDIEALFSTASTALVGVIDGRKVEVTPCDELVENVIVVVRSTSPTGTVNF